MMNIVGILQDQQQELKAIDVGQFCSRQEEKLFDFASSLAQVVIGVRRSGKSTLCIKMLKEKGIKFGYVNFDDEQLANLRPEQLNDVLDAVYKVYGNVTHIFLMRYKTFLNGLCLSIVCCVKAYIWYLQGVMLICYQGNWLHILRGVTIK